MTTLSPRRILLIDADAFFVAVARQEDPEGAGQATLLIVGGRPGSRGVVCSASYECRAYGVRSAMPISRALKLCPQATCVPVPRGACSARSKEIQQVLAAFAPVVQASSIDKWYCDMGGTEALYGHESLEAPVEQIADRLGIGVLAHRRETRSVRKHYCCEFPLSLGTMVDRSERCELIIERAEREIDNAIAKQRSLTFERRDLLNKRFAS